MSTKNMCFHKENQKENHISIIEMSPMKFSLILPLLGGQFATSVFRVIFLKPKNTVR